MYKKYKMRILFNRSSYFVVPTVLLLLLFTSIIFLPQRVISQQQTTTHDFGTNQTSGKNFLTYENSTYGTNSTYGIKIQYPNDWIKIDDRKTNEVCKSGVCVKYPVEDINFYGFKLKSKPPPSALGTLSIQSIVYTIPPRFKQLCGIADCPSTLEQLVSAFKSDMQGRGFQITGPNATTLAGNPALKMQVGTLLHIFTLIPSAKGNIEYDIDYPIADWVSMPTIQKMINSFQIIHAAASNSSSLANELG
jgi:hypothetical protein